MIRNLHQVMLPVSDLLIHRDDDGVFGPPGTEEWMALFRDPDGNALALASRIARPASRV